jgi:hypothetical protein
VSNQPANQTPLDAESAYAVVSQRVYAPRFFEKLAQDFNLRPRNEQEALQLLTMGSRLRQAYDADQEKQAAQHGGIGSAYAALEERLGAAPQGDAVTERFRKQAAANGALDAELAHAVLSLQLAGVQSAAA